VGNCGPTHNGNVWQSSGTGEGFAHDFDFGIVLGRGCQMLPVTTTATIGHVRTRWHYSLWGWRNNARYAPPCKITFDNNQFHIHGLAWQGTFDEHHPPIGIASHGIATSHKTFDLQLTRIADNRRRLGASHGY
jgi:hypothetical protein